MCLCPLHCIHNKVFTKWLKSFSQMKKKKKKRPENGRSIWVLILIATKWKFTSKTDGNSPQTEAKRMFSHHNKAHQLNANETIFRWIITQYKRKIWAGLRAPGWCEYGENDFVLLLLFASFFFLSFWWKLMRPCFVQGNEMWQNQMMGAATIHTQSAISMRLFCFQMFGLPFRCQVNWMCELKRTKITLDSANTINGKWSWLRDWLACWICLHVVHVFYLHNHTNPAKMPNMVDFWLTAIAAFFLISPAH